MAANIPAVAAQTLTSTPYSTNSLFNELFKKFRGALLVVCETIQGSMIGYDGVGLLAKTYHDILNTITT